MCEGHWFFSTLLTSGGCPQPLTHLYSTALTAQALIDSAAPHCSPSLWGSLRDSHTTSWFAQFSGKTILQVATKMSRPHPFPLEAHSGVGKILHDT